MECHKTGSLAKEEYSPKDELRTDTKKGINKASVGFSKKYKVASSLSSRLQILTMYILLPGERWMLGKKGSVVGGMMTCKDSKV